MNSRRALELLRSSVEGAGQSADLLGAFYGIGISGSTQFKAVMLDRVKQEAPDAGGSQAAVRLPGTRVQSWTLQPAPGPDPLATDAAAEYAAPLFAYEITTVRPGSGESYLAAVRGEREPVMLDHGHRLIGAYTAVIEPCVVTLWACDVDAHIRLQRAYDAAVGLDSPELADDRLLGWRRRVRQFAVGPWREHLMVPFPGSVLAPR